MNPRVIILSAPSGAGKTSLARALLAARHDMALSVSHTTRARRPGEIGGQHYFFVDRSTFESMIRAGQFLEYAHVFDYLYGTARQQVEARLDAGRNVVLDIDWQGARQVRTARPDAVSVFIFPPSLAALEQRLRDRGQDAPAVIERRMQEAIAEMRHYPEYDHVVVNDDFDQALADLDAIVGGRLAALRAPNLDFAALLAGEQSASRCGA